MTKFPNVFLPLCKLSGNADVSLNNCKKGEI